MNAEMTYVIPGILYDEICSVVDWYKEHKDGFASDPQFDWAMERLIGKAYSSYTDNADFCIEMKRSVAYYLKEIVHEIEQEGSFSERKSFNELCKCVYQFGI